MTVLLVGCLLMAAALIAAFGTRLSWAGAVGAATIVSAATLAATMAALPRLEVPLLAGLTGLVAGVSLTSGVVLFRSDRPLRWSRDTTWCFAATVVVPLIATLGAGVGRARDVGPSWALWNDGIYHLTGTRQIVADGGLLSANGNRDPLANEVLAVATAPGRSAIDPHELLAFDAGRQALVVMLLLVWLSVLVSVIVATGIPARQRGLRVAVAIGAGLLPWTWFISGFALRFGFINALVSIVILLAAWLVWVEAPRSPTSASALLMLAAMALLAAWAVLAVVPMAWGAWTIWRHRREHLALRGSAAAAWLTTLGICTTYALWITAPTVKQSGEVGLTAEGGFFDFAPFAPAMVLGVLLALALLATRSTGDTWSRTGALAFGVAAMIGLVALLRQRLGTDLPWWGYYPQKYTWVLSVLAVIMAGRLVAQAVSVDLRRRRDAIAAPFVVVGASLAMMLTAPPSASPLVAPGVRQVAPALTVVDAEHGTLADDLGYLSSAAPVLFAHSGPGGPVVLSRYLTDYVAEAWVNEWTVELARRDGSTMSRRDVQRLDLRRATGLCELLATSDRPVRVLSRDPGLRDRVGDQCPEESPVWTLDD